MDIVLAKPRGFCAGVVRAIEIVERALEIYPSPIYVLHEIVHNRHVVNSLRVRGVIFVETLDEIPHGSVCIFSAHGVATTIVKGAESRQLEVIDATCPLVTKVHLQAQRYAQQGYEIIIIGHAGHPEVEGTRGCINDRVQVVCSRAEVETLSVKNPDKLAYVTQTTLSLDDTRDVIAALVERFPMIQGPATNDICYATQNRQNAVRQLTEQVDVLVVVGAHNSSNSNRLREVGSQGGIQAYLIEDDSALEQAWFEGKKTIGVTAGASTPEVLVKAVLARLAMWGITHVVEMLGESETTTFKIPVSLLKTSPHIHDNKV